MTLLSWLGTVVVCSLWLGLACLCLCLYFRGDVFPLFIGSNFVHEDTQESSCSDGGGAGMGELDTLVDDSHGGGVLGLEERLKGD